ncbi:hypothetical protein N9L83_00465 [Flavobacteriales bacterium]|nr:hypothetical protein [Flavobacteriales bacterium]
MGLYKFHDGLAFCDSMGFPEVNEREIGIVREEIDLRKAIESGEIRFGEDGVYLTRNGKEFKGYIYLIAAHIKQFDSAPRFHLHRCGTIQTFIEGQKIQRYGWSNAPTNTITDIKDDNFKWHNFACEYCGNCRKLNNEIFHQTTKGFHKKLLKEQPKHDPIEALMVQPTWNDIV